MRNNIAKRVQPIAGLTDTIQVKANKHDFVLHEKTKKKKNKSKNKSKTSKNKTKTKQNRRTSNPLALEGVKKYGRVCVIG